MLLHLEQSICPAHDVVFFHSVALLLLKTSLLTNMAFVLPPSQPSPWTHAVARIQARSAEIRKQGMDTLSWIFRVWALLWCFSFFFALFQTSIPTTGSLFSPHQRRYPPASFPATPECNCRLLPHAALQPPAECWSSMQCIYHRLLQTCSVSV